MKKRSVVIAGRHNTSITLEDEFMEELILIAQKEQKTINDLITEIDSNRITTNLSSAVRIYILNYVKKEK
jgi:predicted DNA-binding ribbon-helix-helix protein